jgi:nucleotide-binding universal stress UspA family protein
MFRTIMVHVDGLDGTGARTRLAATLAARFDAVLVGMTATALRLPLELYDAALGTVALGPDSTEIDRAAIEADFARDKSAFLEVTRNTRLETDWREVFEEPGVAIVTAATVADLIVLGSGDHTLLGNLNAPNVGDVVLHTGRPLLVVPARYAGANAGTSIVVAWKNTPQSQRALSDALPFMKGAQKVVLLSVQDKGGQGTSGDDPSLAEAQGFLLRHGIAAKIDVRVRDKAVAVEDEVIAFAERQKADLIVAGAYGHTRMREWAFGGVTRGLLDRSPVPCLFSH